MKHFIILIFTVFIFVGCSNKHDYQLPSEKQFLKQKAKQLSLEVESISKNIDKKEAYSVALNALVYSKYLAKEYDVNTPALFHNLLINLNIKKRGLCYHYANDLLEYLKTKKYKTFKFEKVVSSPNQYFEHTSIIITRDDIEFRNSIVLDAWRDTGNLYFSKVKDDKRYDWELK
ncbi:hypothetical protein [Halarcobacter anaerophilus]|jgi:hypothetical protein|uniref:hypothetical protein n=1 Tax=Halarcobacter anaerophilus TaxID=877500 RepID=UPI0005C9F38E|nr:hypothetical protein [Halarcobacter anaerophilus]